LHLIIKKDQGKLPWSFFMVQPVSRVGMLGDATQALRLQATLTPAYYKE
jgi:hypothetical protein